MKGFYLIGVLFCLVSFLPTPARGETGVVDCRPSIEATQQKALRYAGLNQDDFEDWRGRVRWSAALPKLQFGFDRDLKDVVSLATRDNISITGGDVTIGPQERNFDEDFNEGTSFEVKAVWDLAGLVFNSDEMNVSSVARLWVRERNLILSDLEETYFEREELVKQAVKIVGVNKRRRLETRIRVLTAHLDGLTGGWFSRQCP